MKILKISLLAIFSALVLGGFSSPVFAGEATTILPGTEQTQVNCEKILWYVNLDAETARNAIKGRDEFKPKQEGADIQATYLDILACAIRTGDIKLWMVPFFIRFFLEFIIGIAGLVAVGGVIYGGYLYLFAGLSDDKEKGKNAIKNGLLGLVLILTAWAIVNIVIALVSI